MLVSSGFSCNSTKLSFRLMCHFFSHYASLLIIFSLCVINDYILTVCHYWLNYPRTSLLIIFTLCYYWLFSRYVSLLILFSQCRYWIFSHYVSLLIIFSLSIITDYFLTTCHYWLYSHHVSLLIIFSLCVIIYSIITCSDYLFQLISIL